MKKRNSLIILSVIFLSILFLRLYFVPDNFSNDESYYYLEKINLDKEILYLISEIILMSSLFLVYLISMEISGNESASIISGIISVFSPLLFKLSFNSISLYKVLIPISLALILCFLKIKEYKFRILFIFLSVFIALTTKASLIVPLTLLIYLFILESEGNHLGILEKKYLILSSLIILLVGFIFNDLFSRNLIPLLIEDQFLLVSIASFSYLTGVIPLVLGLSGVYLGYFRKKSKKIYLLTSVLISLMIVLSFRLVTITEGVLFISIIFSVFSSLTLSYLLHYSKKTIVSRSIFISISFVLILSFSIIPSFTEAKDTEEINLDPVLWMDTNLRKNSKVLANVFEGNTITYYTGRNVLIKYPFKEPGSHNRFKAVRQLYTTGNFNTALRLIEGYNIDYIYLSKQTKDMYNINEISYINSGKFNKIYDDSENIIWEIKNA